METLRIATRRSPLALWQAEHVRERLRDAWPELAVELVPMRTTGDRVLDRSLARVGGKGLFVKELEQALLEGRADIAVHSMKDVPERQPEGLALCAFLASADVRDALVDARGRRLGDLPPGARVGTASLRRRAQLLALRPDLAVGELRGNVGTRLARLDAGDFDAILLACAGLERLGLAERISEALDPARFVPAAGQGIIGIECRSDDARTRERIAALDDPASRLRLDAERAVCAVLGGACHVPVAAHARLVGDRLHLTALVADPDGRRVIRDEAQAGATDAQALGRELGRRLLEAGGRRILASLGVQP